MSEQLAQLEKKGGGVELNLLKGHGHYINGADVDLTTPLVIGNPGAGVNWSMIANKQGFSTFSFSSSGGLAALGIIGLKKNGDIGTIYNAILQNGTISLGDYDYISIAASCAGATNYTVSLS